MPFTSAQIPPPTFSDPWVTEDGVPTTEIVNWVLITLLPAIAQSPSVSGTGAPPYSADGLTDAVPVTPIPIGALSTALYRVSVYLRITAPDGVSSSVTPFVTFPNDGVTCTMPGQAMTSDAIDQPSSQTFLVEVDAPGPISFGTLYASGTPNAATYKAVVTVERVQ